MDSVYYYKCIVQNYGSKACVFYFSPHRGLKEATDLSRFRMLKYLWLNHNKIPKITGLASNYRLSELYINNNALCDITGTLKHLTSLQTLRLNNNYLSRLPATVKELKGMTNLRTLSLYHNPLAQNPDYRPYVIYHLPSVELFDREKVTHKEREDYFKLFNPERTAVIQSIGFGRRTDSVLSGSRTFVPHSIASSGSKSPRNHATANNLNRMQFHNFEDAVLLRAFQRSIMQFSLLDWSKIPSSKQKRMEDQSFEAPQLITITFR
ncbi:leucine-rich repeat-containing protein 72 [Ascaphus truei]|uniref:leucine-rich repeat-containing protein 72 n=1 Tax=Ascaphus truei TaxID=8439 RepID=UPI003F59E1EB